jgi:hypothetical protein
LKSIEQKQTGAREPMTITIDSETLDLLDHFIPNMTRENVEFFVRTLLRQAGQQAAKRDKDAGRDFKEYMRTHPEG